MASKLPAKLVIAVGTYEGVLAGWEASLSEGGKSHLNLTFATPVHEGSVRSLCLAAAAEGSDNPGSLVSCGYDEMLRTHDWKKRLNSSGEVRTPADFGTPTCSSFAPPNEAPSTHCILGFSNGKLVLYKKRDWSVQHVLAGHDGGVASLAVHPTGKMALTGGQSDGKLKLWDLTKGRLSYTAKISPSAMYHGKTRYDPICSVIWSPDGNSYALAHGKHITVRDVATGKDLLDVELPGRVNQIIFMTGKAGTFIAAACNDGSLPVLAVQDVSGEDDTRRAIMAIEPIEDPVAGEERFKCIQSIHEYLVVTANSAGVVSIMNLEGAVGMIMTDAVESDEEEAQGGGNPAGQRSEEDSDDEEERELAVDIVESVRLGSGARITCLATWFQMAGIEEPSTEIDGALVERSSQSQTEERIETNETKGTKRKMKSEASQVAMDPETVEKARALVRKAKKLKQRKDKKNREKGNE